MQVLSKDADWFPDIEDAISPVQWADLARGIDSAIKERGLSREHRRTLKRQLFKASQPKPLMRQWLANQDASGDLADILRLYPMRPQDARILGRYVLGQATTEEAQEAFLESLRDPRWMMQWFAAHHDRLTPITEWLRGPSRDMANRVREVASRAKEARRLRVASGAAIRVGMLTISGWLEAQDLLLLNVANRLLNEFYPGAIPVKAAELVDTRCPGLSSAIRSFHSALWDCR